MFWYEAGAGGAAPLHPRSVRDPPLHVSISASVTFAIGTCSRPDEKHGNFSRSRSTKDEYLNLFFFTNNNSS